MWLYSPNACQAQHQGSIAKPEAWRGSEPETLRPVPALIRRSEAFWLLFLPQKLPRASDAPKKEKKAHLIFFAKKRKKF